MLRSEVAAMVGIEDLWNAADMPTAPGGNIANSRMELTAKHPFCPSVLDGPESLDVISAQGLGGQQPLLLEVFKVILKALHKQILLILELGVEAGLIDSGSHFQFVKTGVSKPSPPENGQRLL
jgi:hypothetical protein